MKLKKKMLFLLASFAAVLRRKLGDGYCMQGVDGVVTVEKFRLLLLLLLTLPSSGFVIHLVSGRTSSSGKMVSIQPNIPSDSPWFVS